MHNAIAQYRKLDIASRVESATPKELVQLLFDGALNKLQVAKGCIERQDIAGRGAALNEAVSIVEGLQGSLDMEAPGSLARNLDDLYTYVMRQLLHANRHNDAHRVSECIALLSTVSEAWASLEDEVATAAPATP